MSVLHYRTNARNDLTGRTHLAVSYPSVAVSGEGGLKCNSAPANVSVDAVPKLMFASEEYRVLESQKGLRVMVHCDRCGHLARHAAPPAACTRSGTTTWSCSEVLEQCSMLVEHAGAHEHSTDAY
jgi:hypothetical protein